MTQLLVLGKLRYGRGLNYKLVLLLISVSEVDYYIIGSTEAKYECQEIDFGQIFENH